MPVTVTLPIVAAGAVVSMTNVLCAAVPMLPAWSTARTRMVCEPSDRPVSSRGLVHVANAPLSRLHSKRATSVAVLENVTVAVVPVTVTLPMVAAGAVVSMTNAALRGGPDVAEPRRSPVLARCASPRTGR